MVAWPTYRLYSRPVPLGLTCDWNHLAHFLVGAEEKIRLRGLLDPARRRIRRTAGAKPYPFVEKSPVLVRVRTSAYVLTGSTHLASHQRMQHVIEAGPVFLPLTDVDIRSLESNTEWKAPFAAVNKQQIISLQEEAGHS